MTIVAPRLLPLVLALAGFVVPGSAWGAPTPCGQQAGRVLAQTTSVRVLSRPERGLPVSYGYRAIVACHRGSTRTVRLGDTHDDDMSLSAIRQLVIAGRFVAFERSFFDGKYSDSETVAVYDVAGGRLVSEDATGEPAPGHDLAGHVDDLLLRRNGHVAWLAGTAPNLQVWRRDAAGLARLAGGPLLVPGSLAMSATDLYWRDGQAAAVAQFD